MRLPHKAKKALFAITYLKRYNGKRDLFRERPNNKKTDNYTSSVFKFYIILL